MDDFYSYNDDNVFYCNGIVDNCRKDIIKDVRNKITFKKWRENFSIPLRQWLIHTNCCKINPIRLCPWNKLRLQHRTYRNLSKNITKYQIRSKCPKRQFCEQVKLSSTSNKEVRNCWELAKGSLDIENIIYLTIIKKGLVREKGWIKTTQNKRIIG